MMKLEFIHKDVVQLLTLCLDENINSSNTMLAMWRCGKHSITCVNTEHQ